MPAPLLRNTRARLRNPKRERVFFLANSSADASKRRQRLQKERRKVITAQTAARTNVAFREADRPDILRAFRSCSSAAEALEVAKSIIAVAFPVAASASQRTLPSQAPALYKDRDKSSYTDPITFYQETWKDFIDILYLDDLNHLDPKLVPAIRSYCQRVGYQDEEGKPLLPKDILPQVRPERGIVVTAEPGTVAYEVQRAKVARRERQSARRKRRNEPSP